MAVWIGSGEVEVDEIINPDLLAKVCCMLALSCQALRKNVFIPIFFACCNSEPAVNNAELKYGDLK